jgi:hypothetical protein
MLERGEQAGAKVNASQRRATRRSGSFKPREDMMSLLKQYDDCDASEKGNSRTNAGHE